MDWKTAFKKKFKGCLPQISLCPIRCFYLNMNVVTVFKLSAKTTCLENIWFLRYGPKTSRRIRMQDSLNFNFSQTSLSRKVIFYMWLDIHKSNKFINPLRSNLTKWSNTLKQFAPVAEELFECV